jgi:hypothetical protein
MGYECGNPTAVEAILTRQNDNKQNTASRSLHRERPNALWSQFLPETPQLRRE